MRTLGPVFLIALLALGALSFLADRRAQEQRAEGLSEQALALAQAVLGAAYEANEALGAAQSHLAARLASAARRAEAQLVLAQAPTADVLGRVAREERVGRLALLAPDGSVVAVARHPASLPAESAEARALRQRADAAEREEFAEAARALAPGPGEIATEGLAVNRLLARERFGVAYGRQGGGMLLLRAEAEEVVSLKRRFGLAPVLESVASQPGVRHARVLGAQGVVLLDGAGAGHDARLPAPPGGWQQGALTYEVDGSMRALLPVRLADRPDLYIDLAVSTARADAALAGSRRVLLLGAGVGALGLLGAALWLAQREARRRREERQALLAREDEARLAQMGALAALVTHEVSNPLNAVRLGLSVLEGAPDNQRAGVLSTLKSEAARMGRTLESFLGLARASGGTRGLLGPALLEQVRERIAAQALPRGVRVEVVAEPGAPLAQGDPVVLEQALTNLARNAVDSSPTGGRVTLSWGRGPQGTVAVRVDDQGPGFPAEDREALLKVGALGRVGGHGLGLPLAERFVRQQGGRLLLLDAPGGGARVEAQLPASGTRVGRTEGFHG